jgi:hypothetical protein
MPSKPSDQRAYVRIAAEMPDNPKIAAMDDPVASWAHIVAICYCGEHLTDGVFPASAILRKACASKAKADKLVNANLWHRPGHDCETCPQPPTGHAVVHDYLKHQNAGNHVRTVSAARSAAGKKGAAQRWQPDGKCHSKPDGKPAASDLAPPLADGWQTECQEVRSKNQEQNLTPSGAAKNVTPDRARDDEPQQPSLPDPHPGPAVTGPTAADAYRLVDQAIGREHPHAVRTALAIESGGLLLAGHDAELIAAALGLWLTKPHLGPRSLPSLVSEAIRTRDKPARMGTADRRIAEAELLKDNPNPAILAAAGIPYPTRLKALPGGAA